MPRMLTPDSLVLDFFVYDVAPGATRGLTDDLFCNPGQSWSVFVPPMQPVWLDDRRALFGAGHHAKSGLYDLDSDTGEVETEHEWEAAHRGMSVDAARRYIAFGGGSFETAGEIAVFDRETKTTRQITDQNGALLREAPPASWERFDVQRGEVTIEAWLLKRPGFDPVKRYRLVVDVPGGPSGWCGYEFSYVQQALASAGFLAVFCNPVAPHLTAGASRSR